MIKKLRKRDAERLIAVLDDPCEEGRLARLRAATATALALLVGRDAPWNELVEAAGAIAGWSRNRVERLRDDSNGDADDATLAIYELITELNETRGL
ncbi:MAG: hypothetical protein ABI658_22785 [Acidimicrobiales bacterium]